MKTSELTGAALDWAVAKCEVGAEFISEIDDPHFYSTDWAQAGPIIEREVISIDQRDNGSLVLACIDAPMGHEENEIWVNGPTPLVAAMRVYVASKFGNEVEIPAELMEGENQ